jgi:hypothetical protein
VFYQYDNEEHERKAKEVLAGLGEFVVAFERVCASMRSCIFCIFRREGLTNQGLAQVVVNKAAIEGLRTTLGGLYAELRDQDDEDKKQVKALLSRIDGLGTTRNQLLHAEWYLNSDYEGASDEFIALALKGNSSQSQGAFTLSIPVTKSKLNEHVREATEILVLLRRLTICMNQKGFKVSEMFSKPL